MEIIPPAERLPPCYNDLQDRKKTPRDDDQEKEQEEKETDSKIKKMAVKKIPKKKAIISQAKKIVSSSLLDKLSQTCFGKKKSE